MNAKAPELNLASVREVQQIKVLFPLHQASMLTAALFMAVMSPHAYAATSTLYTLLVLLWYARLSARLAKESWHDFRLCSTDTSLSLCFASWHLVIGLCYEVPGVAVIASLTVVTLGLYGVFCRGR